MPQEKPGGYTVEPYPVLRRFSVDAGVRARHTHAIHGLLEMDVTLARQVIHDHKTHTGEGLSFTGYISPAWLKRSKQTATCTPTWIGAIAWSSSMMWMSIP